MKKFFILILSVILCAANSVFAMDAPEAEQYNEAYHKLPRIQLQTIGHPFDVKNLLALQKLLTSKGSRFQTQDGEVYQINRDEFPAICYLAGEYMPYSSGRADLRRINEMTFVAMKEEDSIISHTYEGRPFESTTVNFKKVDLQEYVQMNLNKNLSSSERDLFKALHERWGAPVTPVPGQDTSEQNIHEQDDLLGPWEDLGSSSPLQGPTFENLLTSWIPLEEDRRSSLPQELPPEDLLSAQIFYSDSAPQPAGFWDLKKSWVGLGL